MMPPLPKWPRSSPRAPAGGAIGQYGPDRSVLADRGVYQPQDRKLEWGDAVVPLLADFIARSQPGLRGFTRSNLFRMRQFYEVYQEDEIVAALLRQLSWTHHLIILGQSRDPEERAFYLRMASQEKWSSESWSGSVKRPCSSARPPAPKSRRCCDKISRRRRAYSGHVSRCILKLPEGDNEATSTSASSPVQGSSYPTRARFSSVGSGDPSQVGGRDFALGLAVFPSWPKMPSSRSS